MIAAYIHFDLILFKVSIKIYRLISMTTSIELFKMIFKNALSAATRGYVLVCIERDTYICMYVHTHKANERS